MKTEIKILILFVLTGLVSWLLDTSVERWLFLSTHSFRESLLNPSAHEVYRKLLTFLCFFVLGAFMARHYERRRAAAGKISHLNLVLASLRNVDQTIAGGTDRQDMIHRICRDLVNGKAYGNAWISLLAGPWGPPVCAQEGLGEKFNWVIEHVAQGVLPTCMHKALAQENALVVEGPRHNCPGCTLGPLYRGTGSLVARLGHGGQVYGAVAVSMPPQLVGEAQEQALFSEVAADISAALHNLGVEERRRKAEVELAAARQREAETGFKIQQMLLFQRPPEDVPGASIAAITVPSEAVDGDFYDFFRHNDHCFDIVVADVMGKGIPAALLGAATKSHFLRAIGHLVSNGNGAGLPQPQDIVAQVHRNITRELIDIGSFVTAFYARLDLSQGRLTFVDCGHTKPIHYIARTGKCRPLQGPNLFLGGDEGEVYRQVSVAVEEGDVLLLYSDGVIEARNKAQQMFGIRRLAGLVSAGKGPEPVALLDSIIMELISFATTDGPTDDLTCVAIKIKNVKLAPLSQATLEISSRPAELARLRVFVAELTRRMQVRPLDPHDVSRLELAVNEAVSNIMRHAYHGMTDQKIVLEAEVYVNWLRLRLYHWGDPYDPAAAAPPKSSSETHIGGFGLSMIAQCVDEVRYLPRDEGKACVVLSKSFAPQ